MKKIISTLLGLTMAFCIWAQGNTTISDNHPIRISGSVEGYYVTNDHKMVRGLWIMKLSEAERSTILIIPDQPGHEAKTYYPYEILGYGYTDGSKFASAKVEMEGARRDVFIEEVLKDDSITIYVYTGMNGKDYFFMQRGEGEVRQMTDKGNEYRSYLQMKAANCPALKQLDTYPLRMNRHSLQRIYNAYIDCNQNMYPKFRYGVAGALGAGLLDNSFEIDYEVGISWTLGMFAQISLDDCFSFRPEMNLLWAKNNGVERNLLKGMKYEYKQLALEIPLMFRYTHNKSLKRLVPYGELGPLAMLNLKKGDRDFSSDVVLITGSHRVIYGAAIGGGVEYRITPAHSLYGGARCRITFNRGGGMRKNLTILSFSIGTNF